METNMQTPRLRPKNLGKKKKSSNKPKLRPAGLGATKEEMDAMDRGFRIQKMEGREREDVKKKAYGGKVKKMSYGGKAKVKKMGMGGQCRGMGKATQGGNYKVG
jgi:hypothetical protein